MTRFLSYSLVLTCYCLLLAGCGSGSSDPDPGDWTHDKNELTLTENLRVSEGENFYFGRIADVAVADDGRIYVADAEAHHVKVLSPDGTLQDTVGTRGDGPGEFRHLLKLSVARGDSLYVLDGADGRVPAPETG